MLWEIPAHSGSGNETLTPSSLHLESLGPFIKLSDSHLLLKSFLGECVLSFLHL